MPDAFVPGYGHGSRMDMKRRKRKKAYASDMERDVHDLLEKGGLDKRRKMQHAYKKSQEHERKTIEEWLGGVHAGLKRRKPPVPLQPPAQKRTRVAEEEKTPVAEEKVAEVEVSEPGFVTPARSTKEYEPDMGTPALVGEPQTPAYTPTPAAAAAVREPKAGTPQRLDFSEAETYEAPMVGPTRDTSVEEHFAAGMRADEEKTPPSAEQQHITAGMRPDEEKTPPPETAAMETEEPEAEPMEIAAVETEAPPPVAMETEAPQEVSPARARFQQLAGYGAKPPEPEPEDIDIEGAEMAIEKQEKQDPDDEPFSVSKPARSVEQLGDDEPFTVRKPKRRVVKPMPGPTVSVKARAAEAARERLRAGRAETLARRREPVVTAAPPPTTKAVSRPEPKAQVKQTRDLFKAGLAAVMKKQKAVGFKVLSQRVTAPKAKLSVQRGEPITVAPVQPPRKPDQGTPEGIRMPQKKAKKPKLAISKPTGVSVPGEVKDQPMLQRAERAVSFPAKKRERKLQKRESAVSVPVKKAAPKPAPKPAPTPPEPPKAKKAKPASPKARKQVRFVESRGRGADMKVAPTQQSTVTVTPTMQSSAAGMGNLSAKIDELLRRSKESKRKGKAKSALSGAKKQYRAYRKKALANVKNENKDIKKREAAKINKLPKAQRAAARKKLKDALKQRLDRVKQRLPGKVQTSGQLRNLMASFRTLKV